jgi:hypothetical protein
MKDATSATAIAMAAQKRGVSSPLDAQAAIGVDVATSANARKPAIGLFGATTVQRRHTATIRATPPRAPTIESALRP